MTTFGAVPGAGFWVCVLSYMPRQKVSNNIMVAEYQRQSVDVAPPLSTALCVDLDGTLVPSDTLLEGILALLKRNPLILFALFAWLLRGKAYLNHRVAERANLNPADLPYREDLIAFLKAERTAGIRIVLATGAAERIARRVAAHVGIFDEV